MKTSRGSTGGRLLVPLGSAENRQGARKRAPHPGQDGQALIQVALMALVLLLCLALAVDVGNLYAERRKMQNAADAGALAGARAMCLGYHDQVVSQAYLYAVTENGADPDMTVITVAGNRVTVVAAEPVDTYFLVLIGLSTIDVSAEAEAACGAATSACGMWPLAFDADRYDDMDCGEGWGDEFYVWVDDNWDTESLEGICEKCYCDDVQAYGGVPMGSGHRGWLRLSEPPLDFPNPGDCGGNCGQALKCWLEHYYSGPITIGDCVPGQPGVDVAALHKAELHEGDIVYVLLYDEGTCDGLVGDCPGDPYHVAGFGCIKVDEVIYNLTWDPKPGYGVSDCPKNERVILARKWCDCPSTACGGTDGTEIPPEGVGAVSLVR